MTSTVTPDLTTLAQQTRAAARQLDVLSIEERNHAIESIAQALEAATPEILAANQADCEACLQIRCPQN